MWVPGYMDEPFEWYTKMRAQNTVFKDETGVYIFGYAECKSILNNFHLFSSQFRDFMAPEVAAQLNSMASASILISDPPRHTKMRNIVNRAFTPKRISSYEEEIRKIAEYLIEKIKGDRFDLVSAFSVPLPVLVISRILGVPEDHMAKFKEWSDKLATELGRVGVDMGLQKEMASYFGKLIEERKGKLGDDLISLLIESEVDGEKLTKQDIVGFSILLLAAGNETTTNLITNGVLTLWENPGTFELLKNYPGVIPSMVEEVLRYRSPVQSTRRMVKQDSEFGEIKLKRGDFVKVYIGSANRDPAVFSEPEKFIPERENNRHIAFGEGVHFCLGAPLARLEGKIAFETLTSKYRDLDVTRPEGSQRLDSDIMYGFNRLLVKEVK